MKIPSYGAEYNGPTATAKTITVHPPETTNPVGFIWPEPEKPKRKTRKRKQEKAA